MEADIDKKNFTSYAQSKKLKEALEELASVKKELYGTLDPKFGQVWRNYNDESEPKYKQAIDAQLEKHFKKSGLRQLKNLVLQKLMRNLLDTQEFLQYEHSDVSTKRKMLYSILLDFPFLAGLMAKAAPWVVSKAYDFLKPHVEKFGRNVLQKGKNYLDSTALGKALKDTEPYRQVSQAYNLDPEELGNPMPNLPDRFDGPTTGLLTKPLGRVVSSGDVSVRSLQACFWPENEAYRMALPSDNNFTAVLQASSYIALPVTNNLGNLFFSVTPINIYGPNFLQTFSAAGATITVPLASVFSYGPLYPTVANFSAIRVTSLSLSLMNMIAPLNRSGTISLAVTDKSRLTTSTPSFALMNMSLAFSQSSYHADNYFAMYVPDETPEWVLNSTTVYPADIDSEILVALEGLPVGITPGKVLISYTIEFTPTDQARPLVTVGRAPVAPSTLSAVQMILKHYSSILLADPNTRASFFRRLYNDYGEFIKIDELSQELSALFENRINISAPNNLLQMGTYSTPTAAMNNITSGASPSFGGIAPSFHTALSRTPGNRNRSSSPIVEVDDSELLPEVPTCSFNDVLSQIQMKANSAHRQTAYAENVLTITDGGSAVTIQCGVELGDYPCFEEDLFSNKWKSSIYAYFMRVTDLSFVTDVQNQYIDDGNYNVSFLPRQSDLVTVQAQSLTKKMMGPVTKKV
jgi:hypothetical protein